VLVLVVLAGAMSALFGRIGDRLRRPDVVQFAGMMVMMPFMFVSGAFAPLDTMPGWMGALAALNPVAHAADALRGNVLGTARPRRHPDGARSGRCAVDRGHGPPTSHPAAAARSGRRPVTVSRQRRARSAGRLVR
jgi:hypothetical protein